MFIGIVEWNFAYRWNYFLNISNVCQQKYNYLLISALYGSKPVNAKHFRKNNS